MHSTTDWLPLAIVAAGRTVTVVPEMVSVALAVIKQGGAGGRSTGAEVDSSGTDGAAVGVGVDAGASPPDVATTTTTAVTATRPTPAAANCGAARPAN